MSNQKSMNTIHKQSFQSIDDDYYLQTEEDQISTKPRIKTKTTQLGDYDINIPSSLQDDLRKQQNQKLIFSKPKFIARNIEQNKASINQFEQNDKKATQTNENDVYQISKQMNNSLSSNQLHLDYMSSAKQSQHQSKEKKQQIQYYDRTPSSKPFPQLSNKDNVVEYENVINKVFKNKNDKNKIENKQLIKDNIFSKESKQEGFVDIKTNQMFGKGPRYDGQGNIVQYSIVGRPEWYLQAQENHKNYRLNSELSPKQRVKQRVSMNSHASKTSSIRVKNSIDTLSKVEKKKKNQIKVVGEQMSKEQLFRKLENFEKRIVENKYHDIQELDKKLYFEKVIEEKQQHQLEQFEKNNTKWDRFNQKLSQKLQRPAETTLLQSSVPQFRQKVEISNVLEQVKSSNEILGEKFWEATLRDKYVDYQKIKSGQETQEYYVQNEYFMDHNEVNKKPLQCRSMSSHQVNRSMYRELSYSKGTKVPVLFQKEVEVIKHPKLSTTSNLQNTLQHQTLGQFFGSMNSTVANTTRSQQPRPLISQQQQVLTTQQSRPLISQQMSRRPFSQQTVNTSFRAKTPFNYSEFANANEFLQSIQSNIHSNNHNNSQIIKNTLNSSVDKISQFFTAMTADPDELIVKGESKLTSEKYALLNDGNPNYHIYKLLSQDEINQIERKKQHDKYKSDDQKQKQQDGKSAVSFIGSETTIQKQQQNVASVAKQSNFSHSKKQQNQSEQAQKSIHNQDNSHIQGNGHKLDRQNTASTHNCEIQSYQSLSRQKSIKESKMNTLAQQIQRQPFNNPFEML